MEVHNSPDIHLNSDNDGFSVTVGRASPTFIFGRQNLPDEQSGPEGNGFVLDTQALKMNETTGDVYKDSDYEYNYGTRGELVSRSHPIPIGRFGFTRVDLNITDERDDNNDRVIRYTREFEIEENFRRVTGAIEYNADISPQTLGNIIPGRDIKTGQALVMRVWGSLVPVRVSSMTNGVYGWSLALSSPPMVSPKSITESWTRVAPAPQPTPPDPPRKETRPKSVGAPGSKPASPKTASGVPRKQLDRQQISPVPKSVSRNNNSQEQIEKLSKSVRKLEKSRVLSDITDKNGTLVKKYSDGGRGEIELPQGGGGGEGGGLSFDQIAAMDMLLGTGSVYPTAGGTVFRDNGPPGLGYQMAGADCTRFVVEYYGGYGENQQEILAAPIKLLVILRARKDYDAKESDLFMLHLNKIYENDIHAYSFSDYANSPDQNEPDLLSFSGKSRVVPHSDSPTNNRNSVMKIIDTDDDSLWTGPISAIILPASGAPNYGGPNATKPLDLLKSQTDMFDDVESTSWN